MPRSEQLIQTITNVDGSFGSSLQSLLKTQEEVPEDFLRESFINELASIQKEFILVMDDFHFIRNPGIQKLFDQLLKHPISKIHLLMIIRSDPNLPLKYLQPTGKVFEIRAKELAFNTLEIRNLLISKYQDELQDVFYEYRAKAEHKGHNPDEFEEKVTGKEKILEKAWEDNLSHQIKDLRKFKDV